MVSGEQEIQNYSLKTLLNATEDELMIDFRGSRTGTFQTSPSEIYEAVEELDRYYGTEISDTWSIEYREEKEGVFTVIEKNYRKQDQSSQESDEVDVEIRGLMDIKPENFEDLLE
jgi:hypothetical protein